MRAVGGWVRPRRIAGLLSALLLLWFCLGVWRVWQGSRAALSARDLLEEVAADFRVGEFARGDTGGRLIAARSDLEQGVDAFGGWQALLVRNTPIVGRHIRLALDLSAGAIELVDVGLEARAELSSLSAELDDPEVGFGPGLATIAPPLRQLAERVRQIDIGPAGSVVAPLAEVHRGVVSWRRQLLANLEQAAHGTEGLAAFLEGPSTYLLFTATTSQMHNGMGRLMSVAVLDTVDGNLRVTEVTSLSDLDLPASSVALDADDAARWGWMDPNEDWSNLGGTARFSVTAATAARLWEAIGREPVDGVVVIDPVGVSGLARALGSVRVDGQVLDDDRLLGYLAHDQYLDLPNGVIDDWVGGDRRDRLPALAAQLMARLGTDGVDRLQVAVELLDAARGRHLMFWSSAEARQVGWRAAGFGGELAQDALLLSLLNRSGTKADFFVRLTADVTIERFANHTEVVVDVEIDNQVPYGEPRAVGGPLPGLDLDYGEHLGVLALTMPGSVRHARIEGDTRPAVAGEDGPTQVLGSWVTVPRGDVEVRRFRFDLSPEVSTLTIEPGARSPVTQWRFRGRQFDDGAPTVIEF